MTLINHTLYIGTANEPHCKRGLIAVRHVTHMCPKRLENMFAKMMWLTAVLHYVNAEHIQVQLTCVHCGRHAIITYVTFTGGSHSFMTSCVTFSTHMLLSYLPFLYHCVWLK